MATLNGFKRQTTKLGVVLTKPATMQSGEEPMWFWPVHGADVPNWPAAQWPELMYFGTDHSVADGGVWLYVWNGQGNYHDPLTWSLWDDISSNAEFSHITQKTTPLWTNPAGSGQTETPTVIVDGGVVYMMTHNSGVDLGFDTQNQVTYVAESTNGVDFGAPTAVTGYDPKTHFGDGHEGYVKGGRNPFPHFINAATGQPWKFVFKATHGGGWYNRGGGQQLMGSDDLSQPLSKIKFVGRQAGHLAQYMPPTAAMMILEAPHLAVREGPYWRVIHTIRSEITEGGNIGYQQPVEVLVDDEWNVVSDIQIIADLGGVGDPDEYEVNQWIEHVVNGTRYGIYQGLNSSDANVGMMATVQDVPHEWQLSTQYSNPVLIEHHESPDGINPPSTMTFDAGASVTAEGLTLLQTHSNQDMTWGVSNSSFKLSDYDVIDVEFERAGKTSAAAYFAHVGLFNPAAKTSVTHMITSVYNSDTSAPSTDRRSEPLMLRHQYPGQARVDTDTTRYIGQSDNWPNNDKDEAPQAKGDLKLRIIRGSNKLRQMAGWGEEFEVDLGPFPYADDMQLVARAKIAEGSSAKSFAFKSIKVIGYTDVTPPVPSSTTATFSGVNESINVSCDAVAGATGYKAFHGQNGTYQETVLGASNTGTITGLTNGETYDVFVRAYNESGDSSPSTIQQVTPSSTTTSVEINVSGIPDGTYQTHIVNPDGSLQIADLAYSGGSALFEGVNAEAGETVTGFVIDNNAVPTDGAVIVGVTS